MTALIDDLPRKKNGTLKGGSENIVTKGRYEELLPSATASLLKFCGSIISEQLGKRKEEAIDNEY